MERQCYVNSGACPAGEPPGCGHPSSRSAGRGTDRAPCAWLQTCLFSLCLPRFGPAATGSGFCPNGPLLPEDGAEGGDSRGSHRGISFGLQRLPQHCLCRRAVALKTVIRGGRCRAGPARALRSGWGPWIPPFATSTTLVTAPCPGPRPSPSSPLVSHSGGLLLSLSHGLTPLSPPRGDCREVQGLTPSPRPSAQERAS